MWSAAVVRLLGSSVFWGHRFKYPTRPGPRIDLPGDLPPCNCVLVPPKTILIQLLCCDNNTSQGQKVIAAVKRKTNPVKFYAHIE